MTALEDASAALAAWEGTGIDSAWALRRVTAMEEALRALIAEYERLTSEMHQRELHHFETEQMLAQAGLEPDASPPTDDEREALALIVKRIAHKFGGPSMAEFENAPPIRKHYATAEAIIAAGFRRQGPITDDLEYGAGYEGDDGLQVRWFSMPSGAFTIREAAENEVARYADPQIVLIRRRRPGPWEPVETARED